MHYLPTGLLVAIEGIDGAGKTTQVSALQHWLEDAGLSCVRTKEPTDGPIGKLIRESASSGRMSPEEELNAFLADRRDHVTRLIQPALEAGSVVLVDRYYFSTAAYQGARGLDWGDIIEENERFAPRPALLLLIDVEPELGMSRIHKRGDEQNLFEQAEGLRAAKAVFDEIDGDFVVRVDGSKSLGFVTEACREALLGRIMALPDIQGTAWFAKLRESCGR